jgi:hypothetical protein
LREFVKTGCQLSAFSHQLRQKRWQTNYRAQRFDDIEHEIDRKSLRVSALKRLSS